MKRVRYAGGAFVTSDEVADAVVAYAAALARAGQADAVDILARAESGDLESVTLLIGPSSQLMVEPADGDEIDATDLLADLRQRTRAARRTTDAKPALDQPGNPPEYLPEL